MRNTDMAGWSGGVWNMAFLGNSGGAPTASHCGQPKPFTVAAQTPVIAEKPYVYYDAASGGKYFLRIPRVEYNKQGPTPDDGGAFDDVDFALVYVAAATRDTAASINGKLDAGLHVILTPGEYALEASLHISVAGTVLLGTEYHMAVCLLSIS